MYTFWKYIGVLTYIICSGGERAQVSVDPDRPAEAEVGEQVDNVGSEQGEGTPAHPGLTQPTVPTLQHASAQDPA